MAIELEDDHYQSHAGDPDPDCMECRETWDYYSEAVAIVEGTSMLIASRKHLEAVVEMVEAREAQILTMRELLAETLPFVRGNPSGDVLMTNRINNFLATTWPESDLVA